MHCNYYINHNIFVTSSKTDYRIEIQLCIQIQIRYPSDILISNETGRLDEKKKRIDLTQPRSNQAHSRIPRARLQPGSGAHWWTRATLCTGSYRSLRTTTGLSLPLPASFAFCFHLRAGYISNTCPPLLRVQFSVLRNWMPRTRRSWRLWWWIHGDFRGFGIAGIPCPNFQNSSRKESPRSIDDFDEILAFTVELSFFVTSSRDFCDS